MPHRSQQGAAAQKPLDLIFPAHPGHFPQKRHLHRMHLLQHRLLHVYPLFPLRIFSSSGSPRWVSANTGNIQKNIS